MIAWPAKVVTHVGDLAVIQVPGGLLSIWDTQATLINGDSTTVEVLTNEEAGAKNRSNYLFTDLLRCYANGQVAILVSDHQQVPLLLRQREQLPQFVILAIGTQPAEMDEGTPAGTGLPPESQTPPCCC